MLHDCMPEYSPSQIHCSLLTKQLPFHEPYTTSYRCQILLLTDAAYHVLLMPCTTFISLLKMYISFYEMYISLLNMYIFNKDMKVVPRVGWMSWWARHDRRHSSSCDVMIRNRTGTSMRSGTISSIVNALLPLQASCSDSEPYLLAAFQFPQVSDVFITLRDSSLAVSIIKVCLAIFWVFKSSKIREKWGKREWFEENIRFICKNGIL